MTGSWDKTLRFWDMRQLPTQSSLANIQVSIGGRSFWPHSIPFLYVYFSFVQLPERVFCADVVYPMAAVGLANKTVKVRIQTVNVCGWSLFSRHSFLAFSVLNDGVPFC